MVGLAMGSAGIVGLGWPWNELAIRWADWGLGWTWTRLAMGWNTRIGAGYGLG
jgi:hypothetical protein